ncbi:hypothetical protein [Oceanospirillum phage vB_OsaM_PD0307]|nr:hypothetical protein [Oceanospirillum phage vB_OsaM_PD0307]
MITDQDLNRMIAAYEERNPARWHRPEDLPGDTLEALKELRELREKISEAADVLGLHKVETPLNSGG